MLRDEFQKIAGYEVSSSDYYNIIEPMYMATELSKEEFVKVLNRKRFALRTEKQIIQAMKKEAQHLAETCEHYTDNEAEDRLENLRIEYMERFCYAALIEREYTYPEIKRGCTYPNELVIYDLHGNEVERIALVK